MQKKPHLESENVTELFQSPYIKVYDLSYEPGRHYYDATRRSKEELMALKSDADFCRSLPDAVSCVVILKVKGQEDKLCLSKEFRFPMGQFLLSVPAGLLDAEDKELEEPVFSAAIRELKEETGMDFLPGDEIKFISPLLFSSPGMTDESNALVQMILYREEIPLMNQEGAVGGECFDGFVIVGKEEAKEILRRGKEADGTFYSIFTWAALMCFVTGMWE